MLNYTQDEIARVVAYRDFPKPNYPGRVTTPADAIGMKGVDVARDCLELHREVARLRRERDYLAGLLEDDWPRHNPDEPCPSFATIVKSMIAVEDGLTQTLDRVE